MHLDHLVGLGLLAAIVAAAPAVQDTKKTPKAAPAEAREQGAPGSVHDRLARLAGRWRTTSKFQMDPAMKPETSEGDATIESVLGGRFVLEKNSGSEMGEKFQGMRLYGYNADAQRYEASWFYTRSTAKLDLLGKSEDGGKTIRFSGGFATGKDSKMEMHVALELAAEDRFVVKLYGGDPSATGTPMLETTYTRAK